MLVVPYCSNSTMTIVFPSNWIGALSCIKHDLFCILMDVFISIVDFYTALNQLPSVENISFNMYGYLLCMNCTSSIFERKKNTYFVL